MYYDGVHTSRGVIGVTDTARRTARDPLRGAHRDASGSLDPRPTSRTAIFRDSPLVSSAGSAFSR